MIRIAHTALGTVLGKATLWCARFQRNTTKTICSAIVV